VLFGPLQAALTWLVELLNYAERAEQARQVRCGAHQLRVSPDGTQVSQTLSHAAGLQNSCIAC